MPRCWLQLWVYVSSVGKRHTSMHTLLASARPHQGACEHDHACVVVQRHHLVLSAVVLHVALHGVHHAGVKVIGIHLGEGGGERQEKRGSGAIVPCPDACAACQLCHRYRSCFSRAAGGSICCISTCAACL
jgi:hypothetical protein